MIIDLIFLLLKGILEILLLPLTVINVAIDFVVSIPIVVSFLQIVAYVIPWSNILPLIVFTIVIFGFRSILAFINLVWHFIPIIGN